MSEQLEDTPGYLNAAHKIAVLEAENACLRRDNEGLRAELSWLGKLDSEKDPDRIIEAHNERLRAVMHPTALTEQED